MKIDFDKIPVQVLPEFKGGKLHYDASISDDGLNKIMRGLLVPGASIGMHTHADSSEIIFVIEGTGTVVSPDGEETVIAGECTYCPKGHSHSLENRADTPLKFFAVVTKQ